MEKLVVRLMHYVIYACLFIYKFALLRLEYFQATLRYRVLCLYFFFNDLEIIKGCL